MHFIVQMLVYALAVMIAARVVPGLRVRSYGSAVIFALVFWGADKLLTWLLILLTFPFIMLSLGLFLIVIYGFIFWLADKLVDGVEVNGFGSAMLAALVTYLINVGIMYLVTPLLFHHHYLHHFHFFR